MRLHEGAASLHGVASALSNRARGQSWLRGQRALRAFAFHWAAVLRVATGRPVASLRRIPLHVSAFALIPFRADLAIPLGARREPAIARFAMPVGWPLMLSRETGRKTR